jgi:cation:H+ antiporter
MVSVVASFSFGLLILLLSTEFLVRNAKLLAHKFRVSPLIIGLTIVALGTSLPELAVSTIAAINKDPGLALGNIVGSNIANILLILPVGVALGKIRIGTTKTPRSAAILVLITLVFLILHLTRIPAIFIGVILLTLGVAITVLECLWGISGRGREDAKAVKKLDTKPFTLLSFLLLVLSLIGITVGGISVVDSVEKLSGILGYSTTILGLSLIAVTTSLPELLTTMFSQSEHEEKLTVGNILGSNIYNLTIIGGVMYLFSSPTSLLAIDWIWLVGATLLFFSIIIMGEGKILSKFVGLTLFLLFIVYLGFLSIR